MRERNSQVKTFKSNLLLIHQGSISVIISWVFSSFTVRFLPVCQHPSAGASWNLTMFCQEAPWSSPPGGYLLQSSYVLFQVTWCTLLQQVQVRQWLQSCWCWNVFWRQKEKHCLFFHSSAWLVKKCFTYRYVASILTICQSMWLFLPLKLIAFNLIEDFIAHSFWEILHYLFICDCSFLIVLALWSPTSVCKM